MALRHLDGFDHYASAQLPLVYTTLSASPPTVSAGSGRNGTASLNTGSPSRGWTLTLDQQGTWIVGFSWNYSVALSNRSLLAFIDTITPHVTFAVQADGTIKAFRGTTAGTLLGTSTNVLATGTTYYLEFMVTISDTVGVVALRVNGVVDATLNLTAQDTRNGAASTANVIEYQNAAGGTGTANQDDLYICDGTVGDADQPNNDFLGDGRVEGVLVSGAGAHADFTPLSSTNASNVDEAAPDGDTTYNVSATVGHIDTFAMGNLATVTGVVQGIMLVNYARKTDAGVSALAPVLRQGGVDYVGSDDALGTGYTYQSKQVYDVNPATGLPFTIAEINAIEAGYKKTA